MDLPAYGGADALPWLDDDDLVLGYEAGGEVFADPINILNFHEMVNDTIGGVPLLVTNCPLCFSGVVFGREVDGQTLTFGNTSALYQSTWSCTTTKLGLIGSRWAARRSSGL